MTSDQKLPRRLFSVQPCVSFFAWRSCSSPLGTTRAADDAETLTLEGVRFRLDGIDAPEPDQPCLDSAGEVYICGRKAYEELQKFIANRVLRCDDKGPTVGIRTDASGNARSKTSICSVGWSRLVGRFHSSPMPKATGQKSDPRGTRSASLGDRQVERAQPG
jgi:hypothetical protein